MLLTFFFNNNNNTFLIYLKIITIKNSLKSPSQFSNRQDWITIIFAWHNSEDNHEIIDLVLQTCFQNSTIPVNANNNEKPICRRR